MKPLSRRILAVPASPTMAADARAKARMAAGEDILNLAAGEPDLGTPQQAADAGIAAIRAGRTRYGPVAGLLPLRQAIAAEIGTRTGHQLGADRILVTHGGKQALMAGFRVLINAGDEVLLPRPCWVSTPAMIQLAGGVPVPVDSTAQAGFLPTIAQLEGAITERTVALVINSPSNPTGSGWPPELLAAAAELARRHDLWLVSDEVYRTITYDGFVAQSVARYAPERTLVVDSASKGFGMTGWRVGWAAGPAEVIAAMGTVQSQTTSGVATPSQEAVLAAMQLPRPGALPWQDRMQKVIGGLNRIGLPTVRPQGAFYAFPDVSPVLGRHDAGGRHLSGSGDVQESLLDAGVAVVAGAPFGADGHIRLSFAASHAVLDGALQRMEEWVRGMTD